MVGRPLGASAFHRTSKRPRQSASPSDPAASCQRPRCLPLDRPTQPPASDSNHAFFGKEISRPQPRIWACRSTPSGPAQHLHRWRPCSCTSFDQLSAVDATDAYKLIIARA